MLLAVMVPAVVFAQAGMEPVDQAVGDLDPLSTSLRRVELGLRPDGEQTSLYRIDQPAFNPNSDDGGGYAPGEALPTAPAYYRLAPGFRARLERMDYMRSGSDGQFVELIPANTVFELDPLRGQPPPVPAAEPLPDYRIDLRIDGRVDARVSGESAFSSPLHQVIGGPYPTYETSTGMPEAGR